MLGQRIPRDAAIFIGLKPAENLHRDSWKRRYFDKVLPQRYWPNRAENIRRAITMTTNEGHIATLRQALRKYEEVGL